MLGDHKDDWLAARLQDLGYGGIDGICAAGLYPLAGIKKAEPDTALGYFENNAPRMRYNWFRSRGLSPAPAPLSPAANRLPGSA